MNIDQLKDQLQIINDWIKHADNKLWFISAFYIWILWFRISNTKALQRVLWCHYISAMIFISLVFIVWFILIYIAFAPRLKNAHRNSIFYFWSIAKKDYSSYKEKMLSLNEDEAKLGILEQIHTNSEIASEKMKYITYAIYPLIILIFLSLILFFVI